MQTSDQLLKLNVATNQGKSMTAPGASSPSAMATRREAADPEVSQRLASLEQRLGPAIADSYNNLGVISASRNDLNGAVEDFSKAAEWNPTLDGLDYNWGRAAFASNQYGKAVDPLDRYLHAHPDDAWARAALGSSYFQTHKYAEAVATLQPLEAQILTIPQLASWYAMSLVKSGDVSRATAWLKGLNIADPSLAGVYYELGKVQCERGDIKQAIQNRAE
jgi:predicted Zn-dependent protease